MKIIGMLQDSKDPSPIWSLASISQNSGSFPKDPNSKPIFIAGGLENGNIAMWSYDIAISVSVFNYMETTPNILLEGGDLTDIITVIADMKERLG